MKISKDNIKNILIMLTSFLIGGITMYLLLGLQGDKYVYDTQIYEKKSLAPSVKKVYDTVVVIQAYSDNNLDSTGTGFFYKTDNKSAYILTNQHVIESPTIKISTSDDQEATAEVLGKDKYLDLAVLKVDKKYAKTTTKFGSSDKMNLGDTVFTVGAPLGMNYKGSVTSGVLSGKDRMVQTTIDDQSSSQWLMKVLQIDAAINKGNSGGPLFNVNGEVVGICSLKLPDPEIEGMGFAIPIEYASNNLEYLENGKEIKYPELGIAMTNVDNTATLETHNIDVDDDIKEGVVILSVKKNSSAEKANLKKGDIITEIEGQKTKNIAYLKYELFQHKVGEKITIKYIRSGQEKTTNTKLNEIKE